MKASALMNILEKHPDAQVVVMANEDYENKEDQLSPYVDTEGRVVIQYWPRQDKRGRKHHDP